MDSIKVAGKVAGKVARENLAGVNMVVPYLIKALLKQLLRLILDMTTDFLIRFLWTCYTVRIYTIVGKFAKALGVSKPYRFLHAVPPKRNKGYR